MENFQCHKHFVRQTYKVGLPWRDIHYPPLSSSQSNYVHFECYWQTKHRYLNLPDESSPTPQHVQTIREPEFFTSRPVDRLAFLNDDNYSREVVDSLFKDCNPTPGDFEIDWVLSHARLVLQKCQDCTTVLMGLESIRNHLCFESVLVRSVIEESFEENGCMRPTSKSSLESLKTVDFDKYETAGEEGLRCVVCLEELGMCKDKEVLCMPCSHMFHGECILEWLQNSHYCPLCRFEMPTH